MKITFILITFLILSTSACNTLQPIVNIEDHTITSENGKSLAENDIKKSIMRAGVRLGWRMKVIGDKKIKGILSLRNHTAEIEITYSGTSYNIKYIDSSNLNYDGTYIHRNYNNWIHNLKRNIDKEFILIKQLGD